MTPRLDVAKTYKLFINGQFPRSESGRSLKVCDRSGNVIAHVCHASRKDLRDAVDFARKAADAWAKRAAYNRGQILYRMGEMLEGRKSEFVEAIASEESGDPGLAKGKSRRSSSAHGPSVAMLRKHAQRDVESSIDRLISFAGWADKFQQVLGTNNPVAGPYYNFTVPQATGVCAVVAPDAPVLLGLVSLIAPPLAAGCTIVALGSERGRIVTSLLGEICATSDLPAGVVNLLTGQREELLKWIAEHREIDAIHAANLPAAQARTLRMGASENVKRVRVRDIPDDGWFDEALCESPWWIEPFVEMKTIWHPSGV